MNHISQPLDEGFSEDTHSQPGSDAMSDGGDHVYFNQLKINIHALSPEKKLQLVKDICASFSVATLSHLHGIIGSMVYFDPVRYLPTELMLQIFSELSPKDLLTASLVSRPWRDGSQDERLWQKNFTREGWILDRAKLAKPAELAKKNGTELAEHMMRSGRDQAPCLERRSSRKRPRDEAFSEGESLPAKMDGEMDEEVEADPTDVTEIMEGVESSCATIPAVQAGPSPTAFHDVRNQSATPNVDSAVDTSFDQVELGPMKVKIKPTVFSSVKDPRVSWPWLYKQRRRLERNWDTGTYTMFRLPHPEHEDEGHKECVYTIQHSGDWLVSGSRDKTIRVWNLKTCRLREKPLRKHEASVLCLQFDEREGPGRDIIVSGGSDNLVIIWRFSTGECLRTITAGPDRGHRESVLNLRFDDRYLITCSKDKTIKIWNRYEITRDDLIIPARVVDIFKADLTGGMLPPFTLLDTLHGHQAAVNAVQIHGDIIISASGDRTIKSWDIHSMKMGATHEKSYTGHTKGIACVQFDGRRIVSGSSDNSVRIYDYETAAEVACLDGHSHLVRTVQARFGDLETTTNEELEDEARRADRAFMKALDSGLHTPGGHGHRRRQRNAGSSRPEDMLSYGTKVPPGGGGSPWAKIVSGSYDETIIIWKRDPNKKNVWRPNQRLNQGQLTLVANGHRARPHQPNNANHLAQAMQQVQHMLQQANAHLLAPQLPAAPAHPITQANALAAAHNNVNQHIETPASQQHQQTMMQGGNLNNSAHNHMPAATAPNTSNLANQQTVGLQAHAAQAQQPLAVQAPQAALPALVPTQQQPQGAANANSAEAQGLSQPQQQAQPPAPQQPALQQPALQQPALQQPALQQPAPQQGHHHHHHHHHHGANQRGESNRVFKLQFDARRIIACSQNKIIVGWDFAAGDKDLEMIGDWSMETS